MRIEIICIGDELVSGQVQDQNAFFISKTLFSKGIATQAISLIQDEQSAIENQVKTSLEKSDCVILSGGMGHTLDDHTKNTIASLFNQNLISSDAIAKDLKERFSNKLESLEHQSMVFEGGRAYSNPIGTAPMLTLEVDGKLVCLLPGPPRELQAMVKKYLMELIEERNKAPQVYIEKLYFCNMRESQLDPIARKLAKENPKISFGIYPQGKIVALTLKATTPIEKGLLERIKDSFEQYFEAESGLVEEALLRLLIEKKKTITFAESCSGGALVSRLTKIAGASNALNGAFVTYSNQMKHDLLHVDIESLQEKGAVSEIVVKQMAQGALDKTNAQVAISISGITGPSGGTKQKPVGMVYVCIALGQGPIFAGLAPIAKNLEREQIIEAVGSFAFSSLYLYLKCGMEPIFA